jgi:anti-sigma regulatory factor (Ser/Thr protein kinase)
MSQAEQAALVGRWALRPAPLRLTIQPRPAEVSQARHWFRWCLRDWAEDGVTVAESVFAEVAANAVQHGHGRVTVSVRRWPQAVHCDVRDASWQRPHRLLGWHPDLEHGRGMVIVAALADSWGVRRCVRGKNVWFEVRATGPRTVLSTRKDIPEQ